VNDWKCDQFQWIHYGGSTVTIGSVILEKKFYKIRLPGTKDQLKGHSRNRAVGSLQFKRSAYNFKDNRNLVLVHYEGNETVYVPVTHGNSKKDNASEYTADSSISVKNNRRSGEFR
jgi:hypothetical protein